MEVKVNESVEKTVQSLIGYGVLAKKMANANNGNKLLGNVDFKEEEISDSLGDGGSYFNDKIPYTVSMGLDGKFKYRASEDQEELKEIDDQSQITMIPFFYYIRYLLSHSVFSGAREDHREWSQSFSEEEKKNIVANSAGSPTQGIYKTYGNFDKVGLKDWLVDKDKRTKLRKRINLVGFDLNVKEIVILYLGGTAFKPIFDYAKKRSQCSQPFWAHLVNLTTKKVDENSRTYSVPIIERKENSPTVVTNEQKDSFLKDFFNPVFNAYLGYAKAIEESVPTILPENDMPSNNGSPIEAEIEKNKYALDEGEEELPF